LGGGEGPIWESSQNSVAQIAGLESNLKFKSTSIVIGIIGGTGFIGLNLSWHLQKEGLPCRTFSRNGLLLNPKSIYYSPLTKIEHIKGHLSDEAAVREFLRPCRSIVMLVSHLLPSSSPAEIRSVISWFGAAFIQLLEACRSSKVDQIVFVSSGGTIYGENLRGVPVNEQHPLNPHCAYGSFCTFLEQLTRTFHNQHGLPYTILRLGNPYGLLKRANNNQGIIDHYVRSARAKRPFTIFGDGNEIRDYIYVDDISAVITAVVQNPPSNNIFNVGTGRPHTSKEIIHAVTCQFELPKVPILFQPRRLGDVRYSLLDMAKFEKTYDLRCTTTLKEGLKTYAEQESLGCSV
jgi:UDP-glucose 4-epimerase